VLLVVRAGKTSRTDVQRARNLLRGVDARILGVVVNGAGEAEAAAYSDVYGPAGTPGAEALEVRAL
jgi:Mrp family chromosome partitioning ATPase